MVLQFLKQFGDRIAPLVGPRHGRPVSCLAGTSLPPVTAAIIKIDAVLGIERVWVNNTVVSMEHPVQPQ